MKKSLLIIATVLFCTNLSAQISKIDCKGDPNLYFNFLKKEGNKIILELVNNGGATIMCKNLSIQNGTCNGKKVIRGRQEWVITQGILTDDVKIKWASNLSHCGTETLIIPANYESKLQCISKITGGINKNAYIKVISREGLYITVELFWNEYSTADCEGLDIENGVCLGNARVNKNHATAQYKIKQLDPNKDVFIGWGNKVYCGDGKINITNKFN